MQNIPSICIVNATMSKLQYLMIEPLTSNNITELIHMVIVQQQGLLICLVLHEWTYVIRKYN